MHWLISKQGTYHDSQVIVALGTKNEEIPPICADSLDLVAALYPSDEPVVFTNEKFANELNKAINGYKANLKEDNQAVVMGMEPFTTAKQEEGSQKEDFSFDTRNRRPPLDNVNALLSFSYSLLLSTCISALESVGLDPYVGFLHRDRPGRASLALDLMEELRPALADKFVLSLINRKEINKRLFYPKRKWRR